MAVFKCKMCGGSIEFEPGASVGVCDSCGTKQTLPRLDDDRRANLYDRANHFRRNNEFDKAAGLYEQILNEDPSDAEAYWSLVLCRFGIEYVEDPATHKRVPTVNRTQYTSIFDDEDYKSALRYADGFQRGIYEEEAAAINEIQKAILAISQQEKPFDVFICYKETDANGRRTPDSVLATDLYHQLTQEGFKVFFARITLEDKLGTAYEPYIFAALNSAKVMVVLGTRPEYFNAVWVKNEWSRYLSLVKASGGKKVLIPAYRDMDPYDLPEEFSHLQAQDMSKLGFMQDLIRGIKKIIGADEPKAPVKESIVMSSAANIAPLLKRAFMFLEDGDFSSADEYCERVLDQDPENAQAYLGKLMAELKVSRQDDLANQKEPFDSLNSYRNAIRFGDEKLASTLRGYIDHINDRNENDRLTSIYNDAVSAMKAATTEVAFKSAAETFKAAPGFKNADKLADLCVEKAEISRKDAIYSSALSQMTGERTDRYEEAVRLFQSISGWRDADEKVYACREKIKEIKAKEEVDRLEVARRIEQERIAAEAAAKKRKKTIAIITPILVACIVFVVVLLKVIIPNGNYNKAKALLDAGQFDEAIAAFEAMDNYKDSAAQITAAKAAKAEAENAAAYEKADALLASGDYDGAISAFKKLGDYRDSAVKAEEAKNAKNEPIYAAAETLMFSGQYKEAWRLYEELGDYKDSSEKAESMKSQYYTSIVSNPNPSVGETVSFGIYEQDNNTANGKESIEWLVLAKEKDRLLVISRYALDCQLYNSSDTNITWERCTLRSWLNGTFLRNAFSTEEQALIPTVTVSADKNPQYSTDPGNSTNDRVFLLSIPEVNKYFANDTARKCEPTAYAKAQGCHIDISGIFCAWWLRSPGSVQDRAADVPGSGSVYYNGGGVDNEGCTVRPAMWIDLGA